MSHSSLFNLDVDIFMWGETQNMSSTLIKHDAGSVMERPAI